MSETRFPPAGVRCVDCGCCYANVYAGNDPLCWACDAGAHGPKKTVTTAVVKNSPACEETRAREEATAPVVKEISPVVRKAEPAKATPLLTEEPMPRGKYESANRTPDHIRQAILAADPSVSNQAVADKYGVSYATVWSLRKSAGIKVTRAAGGGQAGKGAQREARACRHRSSSAGEVRGAGDSACHRTRGSHRHQAEKFWSILSIAQKQQIVKASIFSILNPAQEA